MNYTRTITEKELSAVTALSCDVVNSMNFTEAGPLEDHCNKFVELLDGLENRYGNSELVARARFSFDKLSRHKMEFYKFTRDMIRMTKDPLDYADTIDESGSEQPS
ncbi:MAG: hypothetical protein WBM41_06445 [Arenicellales bacterium]|jgi:hypothetical protein